eukprot:CAMPEP_0194042564 /NCGR_PEP_ID=MMETSP0009_2-20130614/14323_1 /TAXON_ID=210454 /ORGANISM="Grammatophora oceanica, Strain CCMP 410" /LENGTH=388 /DNA_ID=CAMNT_0038686451 /DNA_START=139 /DNA_END=1305 /DNA_ORIENTATION=+
METQEMKKICHWCNDEIEEGGSRDCWCGRCQAVAYCSRGCQTNDWKRGGHRELCGQQNYDQHHRDLHAALLDLFRSEYTWLQGLTLEEKGRLIDHETGNDFLHPYEIDARQYGGRLVRQYKALNHLIRAGEIALAVVGAINCVYIDFTQTLTTKFWHELLEPWFQRYSELLTRAGFQCRFVDHSVKFQDRKCKCPIVNCNNLVELGPGILCINTNNLTPDDVRRIDTFFATETQEREVKPLYADFASWTPHLAELQSTPEELEDPGGSFGGVAFYFHYPGAILGASACCTKSFEIGPLHRNHAVAAGDLFWRCYSLMKGVGFTLSFGVMSPVGRSWSPDETARAYLAAAGNDIALLNRWHERGLWKWPDEDDAPPPFEEVVRAANQLV